MMPGMSALVLCRWRDTLPRSADMLTVILGMEYCRCLVVSASPGTGRVVADSFKGKRLSDDCVNSIAAGAVDELIALPAVTSTDPVLVKDRSEGNVLCSAHDSFSRFRAVGCVSSIDPRFSRSRLLATFRMRFAEISSSMMNLLASSSSFSVRFMIAMVRVDRRGQNKSSRCSSVQCATNASLNATACPDAPVSTGPRPADRATTTGGADEMSAGGRRETTVF